MFGVLHDGTALLYAEVNALGFSDKVIFCELELYLYYIRSLFTLKTDFSIGSCKSVFVVFTLCI